MADKNYKNISEVSEQLKINKHVIRYWDSKFEGISTRLSDNKRRFFSKENIKKIKDLKELLYQNGKHNYSLDLAKKIVNTKQYLRVNESTNNQKKPFLDIKQLIDISGDLKKLID
tara:strand:+ start:167 stop:511 length:345 start_codon:yes stop_codon:yes gene_type:complete